MPNFPEQSRNCTAEDPLPEGKTCQHPQVIPDPQVRTAQREGGKEPAEAQQKTYEELAEDAVPRLQWLHGVDAGAQQHPRQEAPRQPPQDDGRGQNSRLRFGRASS